MKGKVKVAWSMLARAVLSAMFYLSRALSRGVSQGIYRKRCPSPGNKRNKMFLCKGLS